MSKNLILVTGGAGFIGTHILVELIKANYEVLVLDNFSNSSIHSISQVEKITGTHINYIHGDIRDKNILKQLFSLHKISSVIHLAGLKAVGESVLKPIDYYDNNVCGTITLIETMEAFGVRRIIFSSSATVYGSPTNLPINEESPLVQPTNPYGRSKLFIENILSDKFVSNKDWSIVNLRYFNPIGAHPSGLIGEDPKNLPNNIMPIITQCAIGKIPKISIFGDDYDTPDGTGVRDYIHVVDLARGHVAALNYSQSTNQLISINLGTGKGYSVLELIRTFKEVNNLELNYEIKPRRKGDVSACYSDPSLAKKILKWEAHHNLEEMCRDSWNFQKKNPTGFNT